MKFAKKQAGLGVFGWLILILVVGGGIAVGLKVFPLYMDFHTMSNDMDDLAQTPNAGNWVDEAIRENLKHRFSIDNIDNFDVRHNITIKRTPQHTYVIMAYQQKEPLVGNMDLLLTFHKKIELKQ